MDPQIVQTYNDEIKTVVLDAIQTSPSLLSQDRTRRKQILEEVLRNNPNSSEIREARISTIKRLFNDYTGLTGPMTRELQKMGFSVTEEGKHYKLQLEGQEGGISVSLSKTPSDYRTGKNLASDIIRTFF